MNPTPAMIVVNFDQIDAVIQRRAYWSGTHDSAPTSDEPRFIWHILRRGEKNGVAMPSEYGADEDGLSDIKNAVAWIEARIKEERAPAKPTTTLQPFRANSNQTVSGVGFPNDMFTPQAEIWEVLKRLHEEKKKPPLASGWTKFGDDWVTFMQSDYHDDAFKALVDQAAKKKDDDDAK